MAEETPIYYSDQDLEAEDVFHFNQDCSLYQDTPYQHRRQATLPNVSVPTAVIHNGNRYTLRPCDTCASH